MVEPMSQVYSIRLPVLLADRLRALADEQDRSFNWQVRQALETFLEGRERPGTTYPPFPERDGSWTFQAIMRWNMPDYEDDIETGFVGTETRIRDCMNEWAEVMRRAGAVGDIRLLALDAIGGSQLPGYMIWPANGPTIVQTAIPEDAYTQALADGSRPDIPAEQVTSQWRIEQIEREVEEENSYIDHEHEHLTPPFNTQAQQKHMALVERAAGGDEEALASLWVNPKYEGVEPGDLHVGDAIVLRVERESTGQDEIVRVTAIDGDNMTLTYETLGANQITDKFDFVPNDIFDRVVYDEIDWTVAEHANEYAAHMNKLAPDGRIAAFDPQNVELPKIDSRAVEIDGATVRLPS